MMMREISKGRVPAAEAAGAGYSAYRSVDEALKPQARVVPSAYKALPKSVYATYLACWAVLIGVFAAVFSGNTQAFFNVGIAFFTGVMFFGLPIVMSRKTKDGPVARVGFTDFLRGRFDTLTGPISGVEALIQVVLVPVCLGAGAILIAYIIHEDYVEVLRAVH